MGGHRGTWAVAVAAAGLVLAGCGSGYSAENPSPLPPPVVPSIAFAAPATTNSAPTSSAAAGPAMPGEVVTVTRVVDGDTFEVPGDRKIRVLAINSCEANTAGGRDATERAEELLLSPGNQVSLTSEPGVDLDPFDRELRYVHYSFGNSPGLGVQDFGEFMVGEYHTGVYEGDNDASDEYVSRLRAADELTGRDCSSTPGPTASDNDVDVDVDVDRDNDRESRLCRGRWWC